MSIPEKDLLGQPLTDVERQVAEIHERLTALATRTDLSPVIAGNAAHALAASWQMMNSLNLDPERPEDVLPDE